MVDVAKSIVGIAKAAETKTAGVVAEQVRDDPADADQTHDSDDEPDPFRM